MAAILDDVVVVVIARCTRPRAMPLAAMTMKTQTHGFRNFYPCTIVMGLRWAALRASGELRYNVLNRRPFFAVWLHDCVIVRVAKA